VCLRGNKTDSSMAINHLFFFIPSPFPRCSVDCACVFLPLYVSVVSLSISVSVSGWPFDVLSFHILLAICSVGVSLSYFLHKMTMISSFLLTSTCFHPSLQTRPNQTGSAFPFLPLLFLLFSFSFSSLSPCPSYKYALNKHKRPPISSHPHPHPLPHTYTHTHIQDYQRYTNNKQQNNPLSLFNFILSALFPSHSLLSCLLSLPVVYPLSSICHSLHTLRVFFTLSSSTAN
jgi:hypothetical protein